MRMSITRHNTELVVVRQNLNKLIPIAVPHKIQRSGAQ